MNGGFTVVVAERAAIQIEEARDWWSDKRPKAPDAVENDIAKALALLAFQPEAGVRTANDRYPELRRLYLRRIRFYLYYVVSPDSSVVNVIALWHSSRESDPPT